VPIYEYRCLECDAVFEQRTTMAAADETRCPAGHQQAKRLLSVFASGGRAAPAATGGCCGGACGCG
jgi:putative FmdB family regulatory protein